uniref:Uncharacterized protein n=1 Tax=Plectus sambesii TaxID=2011161 RepID=A0A914W8P5_9BILA
HQRAFEPLSSFTNDDNFASIGFESTPIFDTVPVPIASTSASFLPPPRPQSPSKPKVIKLTFENDSGVRIREPICHSVDSQTVADVKKTAEKLLAQKTGKLAIVKLTLMDGTELIDDNFAVDSAFGCDPSANSLNVLRIIVTEWIVQTVVERYEQFALNDKVGAYSNWKSALMLMDSSGVLTLSNSGVTGRKALPLLRALEQDCGLRELDLSGNRLQATEMKLLATIVVSQPSLQRLSLAGCSIVCEALDCFIKHLPPHASIPLKRLELSGNPLGDESGSMMASLLGRCVSLEQIDWCATRITAEFARQIRQSLQGLNHLKIVKFARNPQLGANGISVLLQSCSYLVDADFSNSAKSLDEDLTQALLTYANKPGIRTLRRLNIEGCYLPSKSAERLGSAVNMLTNLSHLNISSTSVDGAGLAMLMDVLRHNTVIAELILLNCPINCKDLPPVAAKLRDQPETFPLRVRMSEPTNNLLVKLLEPLCEQRVLRAL